VDLLTIVYRGRMNLRLYRPTDASACLSIFDSNVPTYFAPEERSDFERFLREQAMDCAFQVIERDGSIVACGGLSRRGDGSAGFCWGMVERALHRQGLGRELALARLRQAEADPRSSASRSAPASTRRASMPASASR
jgi:RimJ/RimL family protein N-acetyltransferase